METMETDGEKPIFAYTKDPTLVNRVVMIALFVSLVVEVVAIVPAGVWVYALYTRSQSRHFIHTLVVTDTALIYLIDVLYIGTGVAFLRWLYVMNTNCHGFGAEGMNFSPGWAVGWYFIPVLNLLLPYNVMSEIRRVSSDPQNWRDYGAGSLVVIWWAAWIEAWVIHVVSWLAHRHLHTLARLRIAFDWTLAQRIAVSISLVVAIMLVRDISRRQAWLVFEQKSL